MLFYFIRSIRILINSQAALVINEAGIIDNSSLAQAGLIRWEEISSASLSKIGGRKHLVIHTNEPAALLRNSLKGNSRMAKYMMEKEGSAVFLNSMDVKIDMDELKNKIQVILDKRGGFTN